MFIEKQNVEMCVRQGKVLQNEQWFENYEFLRKICIWKQKNRKHSPESKMVKVEGLEWNEKQFHISNLLISSI